MRRARTKVAIQLIIGVAALWLFNPCTWAETVSTPEPSLTLRTERIRQQDPIAIRREAFDSLAGPLPIDLDFDGLNELVISGHRGPLANNGPPPVPDPVTLLFVYRPDGSLVDGRPLELGRGVGSSVTADAQDAHELAVHSLPWREDSARHLLVWPTGRNSLETYHPAWPIQERFNGSDVAMASFSGDGAHQYAFLSGDNLLQVRGRNGESVGAWPLNLDTLDFDGDGANLPGKTPISVADLDLNGRPELALTGRWSNEETSEDFAALLTVKQDASERRLFSESSEALSYIDAPAVGDLDGQGLPVDLVVAYSREVNADLDERGGIKTFRIDGTRIVQKGAEEISELNSLPLFGPVLADLDPSVRGVEVLVVDNGTDPDFDANFALVDPDSRIQVFQTDGAGRVARLGYPWPINLPGLAEASGPPVVGDIDGDGNQEIVIGTDEGIMAFHHDGSAYRVVNGQVEELSNPIASPHDYPNNAYRITRVVKPGYANIALFFDRLELEEDADSVFLYPGNVTLPATKEEFDLFVETNPPAEALTGTYRGWSVSVPGDAVQVVLRSNEAGNYYGYKITKTLNGTSRRWEEFLPSEGLGPKAVVGSPWLGDFDNDRMLDLVYAANGRIYVVNLHTPYRPEKLQWRMYRHDENRTNAYTPPQPFPSSSPPQLQFIGPRAVEVGAELTFTLRVVDPDRPDPNSLGFRIESALPPGATFVEADRTFRWTPGPDVIPPGQTEQSFPVRFLVSDGNSTDQEEVIITARDSTPPTVRLIHPLEGAVVGGMAAIEAEARDNGAVDKVEFSWIVRTENATTRYYIGTTTDSPYRVTWDTSTVPNGQHPLEARAFDRAGNGSSHAIAVTVENFIRGDANGDGGVNITDAIYALQFLFSGGPKPPILDAADANDDGRVNLTDAVYVLNFLFQGGPPPAPPFPDRGGDPTLDGL